MPSDSVPDTSEPVSDNTSSISNDSQTNSSQNTVELETSDLTDTVNSNRIGHLILPDETIDVDDSQILVGRADLKKYAKDPSMIARSHFTVYKKDDSFLIKNHAKNIQNLDERTIVLVNGNVLANDEIKLKKGDKITVSDVEIMFEVK